MCSQRITMLKKIQAEASCTIEVRPLFCDCDMFTRDGPPRMAGQGRQWIWISTVDRSRTVPFNRSRSLKTASQTEPVHVLCLFFCINEYMNTENRPLYPPSPVFVAGSVKNPGCKAGVFLKIEENNDLQKWGSSPGEILYIYFAELVLRHVCVDLCG